MDSKNPSGIFPQGHRVLIKPSPVKERSSGAGIILHSMNEAERKEMAQVYGTVVYIGPQAWLDKPAPWAQVGDNVIFAKYAGLVFRGADGQQYRLINDTDIVATYSELPDVDPAPRVGLTGEA